MSSAGQPVRTGRQQGPSIEARNELSNRRNSANQASLRRRKIFWVCILCWLVLFCLTAIIIIAVVHFQSSNNEIDQISAGALIGLGVLLVFVLLWSVVIYFKFYRSKARRNSQQYRPSREEFVAFASTEIFPRGVSSTISTINSTSNSRSTNSSAEGNNPRRPIYRERRYDDERRYYDERRVIDHVVEAPIPSIPSSTRMAREYIVRDPAGLGRPHVTVSHLPESRRTETESPRIFVDSGRRAPPRQYSRHSCPLPPPYQPPVSPSYRPTESLPTGTPPPAYDRVCGRMRRCESTTSEDSCLHPPAYQSRPPSPSSGGISTGVDATMYENVPSQRPRLVVGRPVSMQLPVESIRRYDLSTSQQRQPLSFPVSGRVISENDIHPHPSRSRPVSPPAIQTTAITSMAHYNQPRYRSPAPPRYHLSSHLPRSTSLSSLALARGPPESTTRPVSPPYLTARSPFSRPVFALSAPESTARITHAPNRPPSPIQETTEDNQGENGNNKNETPTTETSEPRRPSVVLVYLSQSADEEIVV